MSTRILLSRISVASCLALIALIGLGIIKRAVAQSIVPDTTMGQESSRVNSVPIIPLDIISGGATRGSNLFHSFQKFNVDAGRTASFVSSSGIKNIISRVTGSDRSNILGRLSVPGKANLFLINPNGISFGPNARLAINGSFLATTANTIQFGDKGLFSTSNPESPNATLTINPSALLFNQISAQSITNRSLIGLEVGRNQSLLLVGGDVELIGGKLKAPNGQIGLAGVSGNGVVNLQTTDNQLRLSVSDNVPRANIALSQQALIDVSLPQNTSLDDRSSEASIQLYGKRISVLDSQIFAIATGTNTAGTLTANASESVEVLGNSQLSTEALGTGLSGNLTIQTGYLTVGDGSQISTGISSIGKAANLVVIATESVNLFGTNEYGKPSGLFTNSLNGGDAGDITIQTNNITVKEGAQVLALSNGGQGGKLFINAKSIELLGTATNANPSGFFTSTSNGGKAGDLSIKTNTLTLRDGAQISASSVGGQGGKLFVDAQSIDISGFSSAGNSSGLYAVSQNSKGDAGELTIQTGKLMVRNGGQISASTFGDGEGKGGTLSINASESIELVGSSPTRQSGLLVGTVNFGTAGGIDINTPKLIVREGAIISARTAGLADGGNLTITARDFLLQDRGQISVSSEGGSQAGNIDVTALSIRLDRQGKISTETKVGEGGDITLRASNIFLRDNSNITATAGTDNAGGNGGNINIDTKFLISLANSDITANAFSGRGGNISLKAQGLFLSSDTDITASSRFGTDGIVEINRPDTDPSSGLIELPANLVDASQQIDTSCNPGNVKTASSLVVTERGGIPTSPYQPLIADALQVDWVIPQFETQTRSSSTSIKQTSINSGAIVEATGWVRSANGEVSLVAHAPLFSSINCELTNR
ncbi:filamentous hemagglutinin N-terminal domain-containing protein [Scytonema sp. NUACC26]|uniref:two-partner secretion domain-containing protein n=1 Tax=Scytonema sp. NUACC26 TaxID=3140176 RepID=UPI0034DB9132